MSDGGGMTNTLLVALLLACCALLYLDWRRQGELELLHDRVDGLLQLEGKRFMLRVVTDGEPSPSELLATEG